MSVPRLVSTAAVVASTLAALSAIACTGGGSAYSPCCGPYVASAPPPPCAAPTYGPYAPTAGVASRPGPVPYAPNPDAVPAPGSPTRFDVSPPAGAPPSANDASAQIERGSAVFGASCAKCHGASGVGSDQAPALVGTGALPVEPPASRRVRTSSFRTAADVHAFASANMPPPGKGEKPSDEDLWAVVAYLLDANGTTLERPLSAVNAQSLSLAR